ncbi:MAG: peptidylprolyl isomerase [Cytophagia bacterium]|nr:peptidylprolyl isomerase [Cytophagia bacterium]
MKALLGAFILLNLSCSQEKDQLVVISTPYGEMTAVLYDDTPIHKENFLKLTQQGQFDSVIFHRVIEYFMIQTGDVSTGVAGEAVDYTLDAEFMPEKYIHEKGALAAARTGDNVNPLKKSSGSQFYIVQGEIYDDEGLATRAERRQYLKLNGFFSRMLRSDRFPELIEKVEYHRAKSEEDSTYDFNAAYQQLVWNSIETIEKEFGDQSDPGYPDWAKEIYATKGGTPHLDGEYTVFGKVVEGLDVIDKIAAVETNQRDKPTEDVWMTVRVIEMPKSEVTKKYGIEYPKEK